jgi:hypothetical protein
MKVGNMEEIRAARNILNPISLLLIPVRRTIMCNTHLAKLKNSTQPYKVRTISKVIFKAVR